MARIGSIKISDEFINRTGYNPYITAIFKKFTPIKAEHLFNSGSMVYVGYSLDFDDIGLGEDTPKYLVIGTQDVTFSRVGDVARSGELFWSSSQCRLSAVVPEVNTSVWRELVHVIERLPWVSSAERSGEIITIRASENIYESSLLRPGNNSMVTGAIYRYLNGFDESVRCSTCGGYLLDDDPILTQGELWFKGEMGYYCACGHGEAHEFMFSGNGENGESKCCDHSYVPRVHPGTIHEFNGKKMKVTKAAREQDDNGEWNLNIYGVPVD